MNILAIFCLGFLLWRFRAPLVPYFWQETVKIIAKTPDSFQKIVSEKFPFFVPPKKNPVGVKRQISFQGRLREAQKMIEHEYYSLATLELQKALQEKPEELKPFQLLAEIYLRTKNFAKIAGLKKNIASKTDEKFIAFKNELKLRELIAKKQFSLVLDIFKNEQEKIREKYRFYYGVLLTLQNDFTRAKKIFSDLSKIKTADQKDDNDILDLDQDFLNRTKKYNQIFADFSEFSDGKNPHLFALFAKALAEDNEFTLAKEFADKAIKQDLEYIDAWILRGYANYKLANYELALLDMQTAYQMDPVREQTQYFMAIILDKLDKLSEAMVFFEKVRGADFEFSVDLRWRMIDILSRQKKYDKVIEIYREIVELDSSPSKFISAVHTSIDILKKPEIALEITRKLYQERPNNQMSLNLYAWALIENSNFTRAKEILTLATSLNPKNPRTFLNFGLLYEKMEEINKALDFYKKSYQISGEGQFNPVINIAVEKYNTLLEKIDNSDSK